MPEDIFGAMFESMLKGEMNHHLGYESNDKAEKKTYTNPTKTEMLDKMDKL
ncbi:hypothetical protein GCM10027286_36580 [Virgibacillus ainsalahensis]